jgi:hypothetical protein
MHSSVSCENGKSIQYSLGTSLKKLMQNKIPVIVYGMLLALLYMYSARRVADPDSFELLNPDPDVNIAQE